MEDYTIELDEQTGKRVTIYLFDMVHNAEEIHKKLINKELPCCLVKAGLVVDPFQIVVAANKAVLNEKYEQMITRSLFTEVLYCMSPSKNISQVLKNFGISESTPHFLVTLIHTPEEKDDIKKLIFDNIKGKVLPLTELPRFTDVELIKKTYKIDNEELQVSNLLDSIVTRISSKDYVLKK